MTFVKGQSGNKNGRPKGAENKEKKELRKFILDFLDKNKDKLTKEILKLEGDKFIDKILQLLEYGLGKINRVDVTGGDEDLDSINISDGELVNKLSSFIKIIDESKEGSSKPS